MDERIFRARAREVLRGNWGISVGAAALAYLLGGIMVGGGFFPDLESDLAKTLGLSYEMPGFTVQIRSLLGLLGFVIGGTVQLGYSKFLLSQHDGQPYEIRGLFSQFHRFTDGFVQNFLRSLYVTLWTLVFIIPGIMASYSYAMTPFLMAENPDLTASQAISLSKDMMDGHKGELFALDLSFIGWALLCVLTLNIGSLFLNPYQNAAYAAFYRELKAQYIADGGERLLHSAEAINR